MNSNNKTRRFRATHCGAMAFTVIELIVVIVVMAVLVGLILPSLVPAKARTKRVGCTNYLKQVGLAFRLFEIDHDDTFPMSVSTNKGGSLEYVTTGEAFRHFQILSNELSSPNALACPTDVRKPAPDFVDLSNSNVSYFVGILTNSSNPQALLGGDRNLMTNGVPAESKILEVTTNTAVGWTFAMHKNAGNVLLGDGSVQPFTYARLQQQLADSGVATNRLLIP